MHKQIGLTLIELIVVVAIISILASVAIPTYQSYSQEAANTACLSEANSYAIRVYTDIQLSKPEPDIPFPVARACKSINNGAKVVTITSFVAIAKPPGKATISCDLSIGTSCSINLVLP